MDPEHEREHTVMLMAMSVPDMRKQATVTPMPHAVTHLSDNYSVDQLGGLRMRSKIVVYFVDLVLCTCPVSLLYRKSPAQIEAMAADKFQGQFGGAQRIEALRR